MRKLRKLADLTGWTVEDLIHEGILEFAAKCQAEEELETKIIPLQIRRGKPATVRSDKRTHTKSPRAKTSAALI
jgi:hypothetical protein